MRLVTQKSGPGPLSGSTQTPLEQTNPAGHVWPHPPQWEGSVSTSTHCPSHTIPGHQQVPPSQKGAAAGQPLPQAPQLYGSSASEVQNPPQSTAPSMHQ
jgi:hypothetical protein